MKEEYTLCFYFTRQMGNVEKFSDVAQQLGLVVT